MVQEAFPFPSPPPPMPPATPGLRPVERAQHEAQPGRRCHAGAAARGRRRRDERRLQPGAVLRRRDRHPADRLAALPRGTARHAQQPPVVRVAAADARPGRRRLQPGDLVHGRAPVAAVRPDAPGVRGDRRVDGEHPREPGPGVAGNKPALATDRCFTTAGTEIARGADVWDGILDSGPEGACTQQFPLHSTSRIVAGGPLRGGVYKCALQSVDAAIARACTARGLRRRPRSRG